MYSYLVGARVLEFGLNLYFVYTSSEGSGETARIMELHKLRNRTAIYDFGTYRNMHTAII